jgi:hypothetical protein
MVVTLLIVAGILLELIILVGAVYLVLKYFNKVKSPNAPIEVKVSGKSITSEVIRDGVKSAIQEIAYEEEQERIHDKKMKNPDHIISTTQQDEPVRKSGGNLIPYGLTDSERTVLEMFYDRD